MKSKSTPCIPPDPDSHNLKVTCVYYQVYSQLNYHKPDPTHHGWTLKNSRCVPVRNTKDTLPKKTFLKMSRHWCQMMMAIKEMMTKIVTLEQAEEDSD